MSVARRVGFRPTKRERGWWGETPPYEARICRLGMMRASTHPAKSHPVGCVRARTVTLCPGSLV